VNVRLHHVLADQDLLREELVVGDVADVVAERGQCTPREPDVLRRRADEDVDVEGAPGIPVHGESGPEQACSAAQMLRDRVHDSLGVLDVALRFGEVQARGGIVVARLAVFEETGQDRRELTWERAGVDESRLNAPSTCA